MTTGTGIMLLGIWIWAAAIVQSSNCSKSDATVSTTIAICATTAAVVVAALQHPL